MIDLYTWGTPNGRKVSIMLEELGAEYRTTSVNIGKDEQFADEFIAISPNNKIPAIVDHDSESEEPITMFESGAILIYLAEKFKKFLPTDGPDRYTVIQWLMFQMAGAGPIFGQVHHFLRAAPEPVPYAINRFGKETARLYGVLDSRLSKNEFLTEKYSIADIAIFPWIARHEWHKIELIDYPNVSRWYELISDREAVRKGMAVPFLN
ncbi:MAG: glutathione S-transferase N-terminal domain-containing protein [Burkholderiales bacterium]|nr:glutathione S-transferase N-terminal domain-containing protein [Burkholderiales bacterium]